MFDLLFSQNAAISARPYSTHLAVIIQRNMANSVAGPVLTRGSFWFFIFFFFLQVGLWGNYVVLCDVWL